MSQADEAAYILLETKIKGLENSLREIREALIDFREGFCVYSGEPPSNPLRIIEDIKDRYQMEIEGFVNFHAELINIQRLKVQRLQKEINELRNQLDQSSKVIFSIRDSSYEK